MDVDNSSPDSEMGSNPADSLPDILDDLIGEDHSSPDSAMIGSNPDDSLPKSKGSWLYPEHNMSSKTQSSNFLIGNRIARLPPQITSCEQMCKILLETYNTSIIDYFSEVLKEACIKEAVKCSSTKYEKGTKRKVLAELIRNKIDIQESYGEQFDFVGGPFNITYHWSNNYKKAVYIWGEIHDKKVDFPDPKLIPNLNNTNIENFLLYHFNGPVAFSDFFIEMEGHEVKKGYTYTGDNTHPDYNRLHVLRRTFADCVGPKHKTTKFCKKSRMHFFDIRQGDVKGGVNSASLFQTEIRDFVFGVNSILETYKDDSTFWDYSSLEYYLFVIKIHTFIAKWESFFIFFARFDNDTYNTKLNRKKFWYDQLRTFNIVNKEISVMHSDVRPLLNFFIKDEMDSLLGSDYKKIAQYSKDILDTYLKIDTLKPTLSQETIIKLITNIDNIFNFEIVELNALISDAYLLARVFKTFQIDDPDKKRPTDEPAEPHNIIIYAGNLHSQRYRKFLKYIGFRLVQKSGELEGLFPKPSRTNCVDMRKITQPLFSYCPYYDEDNPIDIDYFTSYSLAKSYDSVFDSVFDSFDSAFSTSFVRFTPFPQPVVRDDLLPFVSVNTTIIPNPRLPDGYGKMRSNPRSKSKRY